MRTLLLTVSAVLAGSAARAQTPLIQRIDGVKNGTVRLTYSVRDGICGDGESFIRDRSRGENNFISWSDRNGRSWRDAPCEPGPARVALTKIDGAVTRVRVYVGGEWRSRDEDVTDLGAVPASQAAKALVALAGKNRAGEKAIFAATIADSAVVWPELLALAKNDDAPKGSRNGAVFWLSQIAGDAATRGLTDLAEDDKEDRDVREHAVFALSQLRQEEGVPILIRLARADRDPAIRRKALFWLGQSNDPRALALFEEILTRAH